MKVLFDTSVLVAEVDVILTLNPNHFTRLNRAIPVGIR
jgi:hypothetical protein